jgi:hypothetical protein
MTCDAAMRLSPALPAFNDTSRIVQSSLSENSITASLRALELGER